MQLGRPACAHRMWGRVYPLMPKEAFLIGALPEWPRAIGAHRAIDLGHLRTWGRKTPWSDSLETGEALLIAASPISP